MVPQIKHPKSIRRALNYNEQKVQKGQAELIHASNYLKRADEMNFYEKLERFQKLMELNDRAQTKVMHVSLNFHPDDSPKLSREFLQKISDEYMQKIGFGNQPYLVYQHHDAGHPHVHIVSTLIKDDGSRIPTHNLGKDISEPARKELEKMYGLVSADKKELNQQLEKQKVANAQKVQYGKSETKRSITNVLDTVIDQYKYTSLAELNAVLKQYNVMADRGQEEGRIYKNRGLTYRVLDEQGQKTGVPIKASDIYSKPTLDKLEKKFIENEEKREADKKHLKTMIDWSLLKNPHTMDELVKALERERIAVVLRRNEQRKIYGITYIDHESKAVFNGSDLGKEYASNRMLERLGIEQQQTQDKANQKELRQETSSYKTSQSAATSLQKEVPQNDPKEKQRESSLKENVGKDLSNILKEMLQPENDQQSLNSELQREEEKRRRRRNQERER
ncbi:relaxase/mobilization nuclease domain-containing protein [Pinibacter aurantiacus]|uniref:Relaxase/mobilization nuclease domain-containing protein n=1 Tax=Pinibacter aurantiacus TaxID=2851599 RepID=A0A9E2SAR8_9BACT|nr:relaxase/mobilization nuclease domain-containing protein [Pinibacter aurantiacus]MBV4359111.1 relaxase/mobilization nuclease domain-containing protein [Pinibacter aurantiacus]